MKNEIENFKKVKQEVKELIEKFPEHRRIDILFDQWNLKDIVAHLNNWMVHDIDCLAELIKGSEPYWEPDIDEFNAKGTIDRKNRSWDEVYNEFVNLSNKLIKIYENLPNDLWEKPVWNGNNLTPQRFLEDDIAHWKEHLYDIKKKLDIVTPSLTTPDVVS